MPYIKQEDRIKFDTVLDRFPEMKTKGELEYCIYKLMNIYMYNKEERYSNLHDTVYAAVHCGDEFRRHRLDKREDEAIDANGDVVPHGRSFTTSGDGKMIKTGSAYDLNRFELLSKEDKKKIKGI